MTICWVGNRGANRTGVTHVDNTCRLIAPVSEVVASDGQGEIETSAGPGGRRGKVIRLGLQSGIRNVAVLFRNGSFEV